MRITLVYAEAEDTFWGLTGGALFKILGKKAAFPPLGLLTVAAMLPESWEVRLVDMNVSQLVDKDLLWADYVFVGGMVTQKRSAQEVIGRCNKLGRPVILGGPILENAVDDFPGADHLIVGEAENVLPTFLAHLEAGTAQRVYRAEGFASVETSPIPQWDIVDLNNYVSAMIWVNRGCCFNCTFCNVRKICGREVRTKSPAQVLREVEAVYRTGFRGPLYFADDNFIGNKRRAKEILRELIKWQSARGYPFSITTEADITLADDPELMSLMAFAGIRSVFLGIETPNEAALEEYGKLHNTGRDLVGCVHKLLASGISAMTGLIVGADADDTANFDDQMISFIQAAGIPVGMVGMLQAFPGTALYAKLQESGRLVKLPPNKGTDCFPNFKTAMPMARLLQGYKRIAQEMYSPKMYYQRVRTFLENFNPAKRPKKKVRMADFKIFMRANLYIGLLGGPRVSYYYWKSLCLALVKYRQSFTEVVGTQVYGAHLRIWARRVQKL